MQGCVRDPRCLYYPLAVSALYFALSCAVWERGDEGAVRDEGPNGAASRGTGMCVRRTRLSICESFKKNRTKTGRTHPCAPCPVPPTGASGSFVHTTAAV